MNASEQLQQAMENLHRVNAQADKTEEIQKLKQAVNILNKFVVAILNNLPEEQRNKIMETVKKAIL